MCPPCLHKSWQKPLQFIVRSGRIIRRVIIAAVLILDFLVLIMSVHEEGFVPLPAWAYNLPETVAPVNTVELHAVVYGSGLWQIGLSNSMLTSLNIVAMILALSRNGSCVPGSDHDSTSASC